MREYFRLSGILFTISAIVALVLAVGNSITNDRIRVLAEQAVQTAQFGVLDGVGEINEDTALQIECSADTDNSTTAITQYQSSNGKVFAVACSPKGYGGEISMMVGIKEDLTVINISIIDSAKETPGLGSGINKEEFYRQYSGKGANIGVVKTGAGGNEVQAVTGATISSRAVTKGVNDAIAAVSEVVGR